MRIDDELRAQIVRMRASGMSYQAVSQSLGINLNTLKSWCRRHSIAEFPSSPSTEDQPDEHDTCQWCSGGLTQRQSRFCSEPCRRTWWKHHPEAKDKRAFYSFICSDCGKRFMAYGNANRKYCSHPCYVHHRFATRGGRR